MTRREIPRPSCVEELSPCQYSWRGLFAAEVQVSGVRRIKSGKEVCAMKERNLHVSCVYSECGPSAEELLRESFLLFLKKELAAPDAWPPM